MILTDASDIRAARRSAIRPPSSQTVSEWADENRQLSSSAASEPGPWRTSRVPYLREVMDVLSPSHPAQRIVLQKSARIGGTEALNNAVGCYMTQAPCPIMFVQPSEADAEEWSKDALDPMLESTPVLAGLVTSDQSRRKGNTILHKRYLGGTIFAVGASTPKSFRRRTARVVAMDEIDAYPGSLAGEGDPVDLAEKRATTYTWSKKIILCSTPTVKGASRIETAYLASDQRHYLVPCPDCGKRQRLVWSQVHWDEGHPESAEYVCIECGALIPHHKKTWMLDEANGAHWVATNPGSDTIGFHISALYSPWVTWAQLAREFTDAAGDPTREQVFHNTCLGETWDMASAEKWDDETLRALREPIPVVPASVACLTASVDVQGDWFAVQIDAWAANYERWTLERRIITGDLSGPEPWAELDAAIQHRWPMEGGGTIGVKATCIDTGGHHTQAVYAFAKARRTRRVWAIKGMGGPGKRLWPRVASRKNRGNVDLYLLGVDTGKEACHARLRRSAQSAAQRPPKCGGPSFWHFSDTLTESYFDELTAEVQIVEYSRASRGAPKSGASRRWVMRPGRARNEALDLSVYSLAALEGLLAARLVRLDRPARGSMDRSSREGLPTLDRSKKSSEPPTVDRSSREELPTLDRYAEPAPRKRHALPMRRRKKAADYM